VRKKAEAAEPQAKREERKEIGFFLIGYTLDHAGEFSSFESWH
jgi:hypothetical protein